MPPASSPPSRGYRPTRFAGVLASSASALLEAVPFLAAGTLLARVLPAGAMAFAGCGCTPGPSARSIPAAAAMWLSFGPVAASLRVLAGTAVAALGRSSGPAAAADGTEPTSWPTLNALVPAALAAGVVQQLGGLQTHASAPLVQFAGGALFGAVAAPCGLGTAALAASLHARAPAAAAGMLCTAGILDARVLARSSRSGAHDSLAYVVLALALAVAGRYRGAGFVHPAIGAALLPCAALAAAFAIVRRNDVSASARVAPAILLASVFAGIPPPHYRPDETMLSGLFAGERLSFTGQLWHGDVLVRYAITCCRADAAPVALRLTRRLANRDATWLHADGTVVSGRNGALLLNATAVQTIEAPLDPLVYR